MKRHLLLWVLVLCVCSGGRVRAYDNAEIEDDTNFDRLVNSILTSYNVPSLQAVIMQKDTSNIWDIAWSKAYGKRVAIFPKLDADQDTIYAIGSITKTFTAVAVLQLVEAGLIALDEPVAALTDEGKRKYLPFDLVNPYFRGTPITIRHLLNHTTGLKPTPNKADTSLIVHRKSLFNKEKNVELQVPSSMEKLEYWLRHEDPDSHEYTCWENKEPGQPGPDGVYGDYANLGYTILGYIIEHVINNNEDAAYGWNYTGEERYENPAPGKKTFAHYAHKFIFDPLGMSRTGLYWKDFDNDPNKANGYFEKQYIKNPDWPGSAGDSAVPEYIQQSVIPFKKATASRWDSGFTSGTIKSTMLDTAKFFVSLVNGGKGYKRDEHGELHRDEDGNVLPVSILSNPTSIEEMKTMLPIRTSGVVAHYGMGWISIHELPLLSPAYFSGRKWYDPSGSAENDPDSEAYDPTGRFNFRAMLDAGFDPANIVLNGHAGNTADISSIMVHWPNDIDEKNDLLLLFVFNLSAITESGRLEESKLQPAKFSDDVGMHVLLRYSEIFHLLMHKGITLLNTD